MVCVSCFVPVVLVMRPPLCLVSLGSLWSLRDELSVVFGVAELLLHLS